MLKLRSNVGGSAVTKAEVFADGSAEFATQVAIGGLNISSNTNAGALIFAGAMRMQRTSGDSDYLWQGYQGTTQTSEINADGSASFTGNVGIGTARRLVDTILAQMGLVVSNTSSACGVTIASNTANT